MTADLIEVRLDESGLPPPSAEAEQERRLAVFDLLEESRFAPSDPAAPAGPYRLTLTARERGLDMAVTDKAGAPAGAARLALGPFRRLIKDYFEICESYFDAIKRLPPGRIETLDEGRRAVHGEGARLLRERLMGDLEMDDATARRLFTLICALHFRG